MCVNTKQCLLMSQFERYLTFSDLSVINEEFTASLEYLKRPGLVNRNYRFSIDSTHVKVNDEQKKVT